MLPGGLWIAWQLEKDGFTTIIQAWDFLPGNNFVEKMDNALKACKSTIAVLSDNYLQSGFTTAEWQAAFAKDPTGEKRSLIPIRIQSCDLAGLLGQIIYIDLVGRWIPEQMMWALYSHEINNKFPFPRRPRKAS